MHIDFHAAMLALNNIDISIEMHSLGWGSGKPRPHRWHLLLPTRDATRGRLSGEGLRVQAFLAYARSIALDLLVQNASTCQQKVFGAQYIFRAITL